PQATPTANELESGLIPPIVFASSQPEVNVQSDSAAPPWLAESGPWNSFDHDINAIFEAHGETICASGCAASRHPTATLERASFEHLLMRYAAISPNRSSQPLDSLLYYGSQTSAMLDQLGTESLSSAHLDVLREQLSLTHARISIRIVDEQGVVRTWCEPTKVPLDRRHVFSMQTKALPPLVTSGTAKRVGLNHVWARL
ncbi:MAG: hypothetical protein WBD31_27295, partial [Rubripirellula sp.]